MDHVRRSSERRGRAAADGHGETVRRPDSHRFPFPPDTSRPRRRHPPHRPRPGRGHRQRRRPAERPGNNVGPFAEADGHTHRRRRQPHRYGRTRRPAAQPGPRHRAPRAVEPARHPARPRPGHPSGHRSARRPGGRRPAVPHRPARPVRARRRRRRHAWTGSWSAPLGAGAVVMLRQRFGDLPAGHDGLSPSRSTTAPWSGSPPRCPATPGRPRRPPAPPRRRTPPRSPTPGWTPPGRQPPRVRPVAVPTPVDGPGPPTR